MAEKVKSAYPVVFVHGMFGWGENEGINQKAPYWGATTGSITDFLSATGVESYAASVGPMSSAWDQACELYAQLMGTTVDYGEAHSKKFGHKRYGRTYKSPLLQGWSEERKLHLIGHSFGGNAIRMFTHLMSHGAPEEVEASGDDASPLFFGGKEELICSVTAICSPLNGTQAYVSVKKHKLIQPLKFLAYNYAGIVGRNAVGKKIADFHLEQFGLTDTPDSRDREPFVKAIKDLFDTDDCIAFDMMDEGAAIMNSRIRISPSVYYFSFPYNAVDESDGKPVNTDFIFMKATSALMLHDGKKDGKALVGNDGLVDVESARHPSTEPFTEFVSGGEIKAGVWNVMPTRIGDHGTPIGLFADKEKTHQLYLELTAMLKSVEKEKCSSGEISE